MGHLNGTTTLARGSGQPIVTLVAINLQDAVKTAPEGFSILAYATWSAEVDHAGRVLTAPWLVIAGQCPQISGFGCSTPRIQHRGDGFIHKQLSRPLQMIGQSINHVQLHLPSRRASTSRPQSALSIYMATSGSGGFVLQPGEPPN